MSVSLYVINLSPLLVTWSQAQIATVHTGALTHIWDGLVLRHSVLHRKHCPLVVIISTAEKTTQINTFHVTFTDTQATASQENHYNK